MNAEQEQPDRRDEPDPAEGQEVGSWGRLLHLALALSVGVALAGYLIGTQQARIDAPRPHEPSPSAAESEADETDAPPARAYRAMRGAPLSPNTQARSHLEQLATTQPDLFAPRAAASEEERARALQKRAENRAFGGAPPTVPHPIDQVSTESCLACHEKGLRIGERTAPAMSHEIHRNCTQCHAPSQTPALQAPEAMPENHFDGVRAAGEGERAYPGAPPTMPHGSFNRRNCQSCHGPYGEPGLQSTHPWRINCKQCHAPSAEPEQATRMLDAELARPRTPTKERTAGSSHEQTKPTQRADGNPPPVQLPIGERGDG